MALTALGAWVGVNVAPLAVLRGVFDSQLFAGPALGLGGLLVAAGLASERWCLKPHFAFTYLLLGSNLAGLAALHFFFERTGLAAVGWLLVVLALGAGLVWYARRTQSYLFLLLGVAYSYVVVTAGLFRLLVAARVDEGMVVLGMLYFPLSLLGVILLLVNIKKILRIA
jgi:hypothetical protein